MALTDVPTAAKALNLTGTGYETWLAVLVPAACACVENYCKRKLETAAYTDYLSGKGMQALPTRQRPVRTSTLTGTLSSSSAVVTTISSTATLTAGLAVSGTGIPELTTILTVDSTTQVTLTNAATASGAKSLLFSPSVWIDPVGYYGRGASAFPSTSLLTEGRDWVMDYGPDGNSISTSGLLIRLGGGPALSGASGYWPWEWGRGTLTGRQPPAWPAGIGNIRVIYQAGMGTGPQDSGGTLPPDLTMAANQVVAWMKRNLPLGGPLASEHLGAYGYSIMARPLGAIPELGETRQLLSRFRELAI